MTEIAKLRMPSHEREAALLATASVLARVRASLAKHSAPDGSCRIWTGDRTRAGYGAVTLFDRRSRAHRLAWIVAHGREIPTGAYVLHSCHRRLCIAIDHLRLGDHAENMRDMVKARRHYNGPRKCGTSNHNAVLTEQFVADLRSRHAAGASIASLGRTTGKPTEEIWRIVHGNGWRHVPYVPCACRHPKIKFPIILQTALDAALAAVPRE